MFEILKINLISDMESLLYEFNLLSEDADEEYKKSEVADFTKMYETDIVGFLNYFKEVIESDVKYCINKDIQREYECGQLLKTLAYWGIDFNKIPTEALLWYISNLEVNDCSYGDENWEASIEYRYEIDSVDDYLNFNYFELLVDYNTLEDVSDKDLAKIFSNLKEKGYIIVLISDKEIVSKYSEELKKSVSGVIENATLYKVVRRWEA